MRAKRNVGRRAAHLPQVAPDLERADIDSISRVAIDLKLGALIVSNTTITRPSLRSRHTTEAGGYPAPLARPRAPAAARFPQGDRRRVPLVAWAIGSAEDACKRIRAGATLVQLYSALVFEGPGCAADRARPRGPDAPARFASIAEAAKRIGAPIRKGLPCSPAFSRRSHSLQLFGGCAKTLTTPARRPASR